MTLIFLALGKSLEMIVALEKKIRKLNGISFLNEDKLNFRYIKLEVMEGIRLERFLRQLTNEP